MSRYSLFLFGSPRLEVNGRPVDSVDALQLVVALDKKYGLKIPDPECARQVLQSITTMADAVARHLASAQPQAQSSFQPD
jgi:hypothetical protein